MIAKHTPGRWGELNGEILAGDDDVFICDASEGKTATGLLPIDERTANARLIAAAPELLAALEAMFDKYGNKNPKLDCEVLANARAAIAKATNQ